MESSTPTCSVASRVGIDVGGTFTDLVAVEGTRIVTAKVPSTPRDQSAGVLAALHGSDLSLNRIASVAHGTTVATNALLERRGARTALVTTAGFRDVIEIGRQNRANLYDLTAVAPAPLVPRALRFTLAERIDPDGVRVPLEDTSVAEVVRDLRAADVDAVAVCLLFSFLDPRHERRVAEAIRAALPHIFAAASSEVLPEFREFERFATTTADAYLGPLLARYLERLRDGLQELGLPRPEVMLSTGGVADISAAAAQPSSCVLSGPAAGVVGAAFAAEQSGYRDLLTFDMGGTSTDVGLIVDGTAQTTTDAVVAGVPIKHPMVDVHTVSAGGGSIAWADSGGALRVGPRSAGALPGPACYGRGGVDVTVSDANLFLGYLPNGATLGGSVTLCRSRAEAALRKLARAVALDETRTAVGVLAVAEAQMVRALRVISIERGVDPRGLTLLAFGGAGGLHACRLAEELEMSRILVPRAAGVLSALGLAVSDRRRDYVAPLLGRVDDVGDEAFEQAFEALRQRAVAELGDPLVERRADVRYAGQSFELTVSASSRGGLPDALHSAHERRYGYRLDNTPVEIVAIRLAARLPLPKPTLTAATATPSSNVRSTRSAYFDGVWLDTRVLGSGGLGTGIAIDGPAVVELPEATCIVRPGWHATIDAAGAVVIER